MNRLYEIKYDKNIWNITGNRDDGYWIIRKGSLESYFLPNNTIGIEQITDDSFLVYHRVMRNERAITRLKLKNWNKIEEYSHRFGNFSFISDDVIIFDKDSVHSSILYSISKNCEISTLQFLISQSTDLRDSHFCKSREIKLVYDTIDSGYPKYLQADYELNSFYCKEFIQVLVDPHTLLPLPFAYSTLRSKYISLNDNYSFMNMFEEQNKELRVIDDFLCKLYYSDNRKEQSELCSEVLNNH